MNMDIKMKYAELKEDEFFKKVENEKLLDYAVELVAAEKVAGAVSSLGALIEYVNG